MKNNHPDAHKFFLELYDAFSDEIFRFALSQTRNRELSLDLAQETFIKTWDYLQKGKSIDMGRAFLYKTCRNLIIDYRRKKRFESLDAILENQVPAELADTEHVPAGTEIDRQQMMERLKNLPSQHYEILVMRYIQELTLAEIANVYKESENTISVRIHRAQKYAQKIFEDDDTHAYE